MQTMDDYRDDNLDDDEIVEHEQPDLDTTLAVLQANQEDTFNSTIFYGLSNLSVDDIERLKPVWEGLSPEYRQKLAQQLVETAETNFDLNYRALGFYGLTDDEPGVREASIELLWEDESLELMGRLIELAQWDEAISVRAAAASELGRFILLGELGDLPESEMIRIQDTVIALLNDEDEDVEVRRRALEAIANCGHEIVDEAIDEAYHSSDERMRASALFAMGRTCDARWEPIVLREIDSSNPALRYEAARASGELEIAEAVPQLARLSRENDREIQNVAIWSLGEIGGSQVMRLLTALAEEAEKAEDDDLLELIEDAIGSASLVGDALDFDLDDD
jgi:HEAT repeat protein